jgi:hypothetical protein
MGSRIVLERIGLNRTANSVGRNMTGMFILFGMQIPFIAAFTFRKERLRY